MWLEECNQPEVQTDICELNREVLWRIEDEMNDFIETINPDVTYSLENTEENKLVIQLKNHKNNAGSRIGVSAGCIESMNIFIKQVIESGEVYTELDIFQFTTPFEISQKLGHVGLI